MSNQELQLGQEINFDEFLGEELGTNNPKLDLPLISDMGTFEEIAHGTGIRGKGRPKGEKNSKNPEKKNRPILSEENRRKGHWSAEENKRYHWFLEIYSNHFICKEMRRLDKIFKTMALFIGSREAEQCRSHHQKMEKKYHSFTNIILFLRNFHYGCEGTVSLEEDLLNNQISLNEALITVKELKNIEAFKYESSTASLSEEAKVNHQFDEPLKEHLFQENFFDFLGEDYEHRLELDNFLF